MKIGEIMRDSNGLESLVKELENTILTATQEESFKKALATSIIGNLFRYFDFDNFIKPYSERCLKIFTALGKDNHPIVREFYLHYCSLLSRDVGQEFPRFFQITFPTCFHQMQTDIKTNQNILSRLAIMVDSQLKDD